MRLSARSSPPRNASMSNASSASDSVAMFRLRGTGFRVIAHVRERSKLLHFGEIASTLYLGHRLAHRVKVFKHPCLTLLANTADLRKLLTSLRRDFVRAQNKTCLLY